MGLFNFVKKKAMENVSNNLLNSNEVSVWLDNVLMQEISEDIKAFCFNLYDDGDNKWSMELVGTRNFDMDDSDWACEEITDFGTRENPFVLYRTAQWDKVLDELSSAIREYLEWGKYAQMLKSKEGIGVGFVDGDLEILYIKR